LQAILADITYTELLQRTTISSYLIYARALLEYVNLIVWGHSVIKKMLLSVKFAEYKVLTFLILRKKMLK